MSDPAYKRILLKLSGEALAKDGGEGIDGEFLDRLAKEAGEVVNLGVQLAVIVGGGNIFRGKEAADRGMDRSSADHMGMLATIINSLAMQDALERIGVYTRVMTAIPIQDVAEPYIRRRAVRHLEKGRVVIFAGGTGNPYFTTDTAAALRAAEIHAEVILKATKVDGVFTADPVEDSEAKMLADIHYLDVLSLSLKVMDATAVSLCMDNDIPIVVFNINVDGNIKKVVLGEKIGTLIH